MCRFQRLRLLLGIQSKAKVGGDWRSRGHRGSRMRRLHILHRGRLRQGWQAAGLPSQCSQPPSPSVTPPVPPPTSSVPHTPATTYSASTLFPSRDSLPSFLLMSLLPAFLHTQIKYVCRQQSYVSACEGGTGVHVLSQSTEARPILQFQSKSAETEFASD